MDHRSSQHRSLLILVALWVGTLCLYLLTSAAILDNPDGRSAYSITRNLLLHGTIAIPPESRLDTMFEKPGRDGEVYSKYGIVQPLVQVPLFLVGRWVAPNNELQASQTAVALLHAFTTSTALVLLWGIANAIFGSPRIALVISLTYGTATMAWLYATLNYSEPLLTLILLLICRLMLAAARRTSSSTTILSAAGALAGMAILTKYPAVIYIPAMIWYVWKISYGSRRSIFAFLAPLLIGIFVLASYNLWRYGDILNTGYHIKELTRLPRPAWFGIYTLFFSLGKSIFIYAPPLLLAVVALPAFLRRMGTFGWFVLLLIASSVLFYSVVRPWEGDWSPGPRYQLPVLPLALLPLGILIARWHTLVAWKQLTFISTVAIGVFVQIPLVAASYNDTLVLLQVITGGQYPWGFWFFDPDYMPLLWQSRILASSITRLMGMKSLLPSPLPTSVDRPGQPIDQITCWFAHLPPGSGWAPTTLLLAIIAGACLAWLLRAVIMSPRTPAALQLKEDLYEPVGIPKD
jgi:hypothetical protein